MEITSKTRLLGLIGNPARHSLSPAIHNAAFQVCNLDMCYFSFCIQPQDLETALRGMTALEFVGFNITFPYKESVLPFLDSIPKDASVIGAVNTVVINNGKMHGYNTDGIGFLRSLQEKGIEVAGQNILIIGAGGAAKAVGVTLALQGAGSITIANRRLERAEQLAQIINDTGVKSGTVCTDILDWENKLKDIDIAINATPAGMYPMDACCPMNIEALMPGTVVCDLIYKPVNTLLLQEASRRGHTAIGGLGMLLHQGAEAFKLFTGIEPPIETMRQALDVAM